MAKPLSNQEIAATPEYRSGDEVTSSEASIVFQDLLDTQAPFSHEQYVRLLGLSMRYQTLPDDDTQAFLDIRNPDKFQIICLQLRSLLLAKTAKVAGLQVPDGLFGDDVDTCAADVRQRVNSTIPPRS